MSDGSSAAGTGDKRALEQLTADLDGELFQYGFTIPKPSTARAGAKVNKKLRVKEIVHGNTTTKVDHTAGLMAAEDPASDDDKRQALYRHYNKRKSAASAPVAEEVIEVKRARTQTTHLNPVPDNEKDHWVWSRDLMKEGRLRTKDWVVPEAIKIQHKQELDVKDAQIAELQEKVTIGNKQQG